MLRLARWADRRLDNLAVWWLQRRGPVIMNVGINRHGLDEAITLGTVYENTRIYSSSLKPAFLVNCTIIGDHPIE